MGKIPHRQAAMPAKPKKSAFAIARLLQVSDSKP